MHRAALGSTVKQDLAACAHALWLWMAGYARCAAGAARRSLLVMLASVSLVAFAAGTCKDFLKALSDRESSGDPRVINPYGYVGLFQMGEAALIDAGFYKSDGTGTNDWRGSWTGVAGVNSLEDFRSNPAAQVQAISAYHKRVWGYIKGLGIDGYVGKTVGGVLMTESGMIAAAHLVGAGNLRKFLLSNGATVPRDGNKVALTQYASKFGGYSIFGSGADCAQYASGQATAGVPITNPASAPNPGPGPGNQPVARPRAFSDELTTDFMSPGEAYYARTGHTMEQINQAVKVIAVSLLLFIAATSSMGFWSSFAGGALSWASFITGHKRILLVVVAFAFALI